MDKDIDKDIKEGNVYQGEIINLANYGAFVKLENNREGLIHISKIANEYVKNVKDYLKKGDIVKVQVVEEKKDGKLDLKLLEKVKVKKNQIKRRNYFDAEKSWNNRDDYYKKIETKTFDEKIRHFLKESDEKLSEIKKNMEAKRT
ncbi:MAG TPA: S1 RNA-binding domain-containing protein [bacterium]|nr:S1 RNA-binding domain-containing protein [bacterium]HPQ18250.1 S1 RNA-binding domain-containing protein [bacterium]